LKNSPAVYFIKCLLIITLLLSGQLLLAQTMPGQQPGSFNRPQKDTSKSNTNQWKDEQVNITYERLNSAKRYIPDTSLHTFHRPLFTQPWNRDMGNLGSPVNNLFFTPEYRVGPTLGYHVFDVYRFDVDSTKFYSTSRPYSVFSYQLGSKLEQVASIMHTQNIRPNWNFAAEYRKISSPGFYRIQRNNHDNAYFSTNYKSLNKHYTLYAAMAYNKLQHDENGGLIDASQLNNPLYSDRKTIAVDYQNDVYSSTRATVSNTQRDFTLLLQHSYVWGNTDTTYSEDSTQYSYKLKPLFSITHKMEASTEKHIYKDLAPDSFRYLPLFTRGFSNNGSSQNYALGQDSVITQQKWFWVDNKLLLNGFLGREGRQLTFNAGLGNRFDQFIAQPVSNQVFDSLPKNVYVTGYERNTLISNYLTGEIKKEALYAGAWEYGANAKLFMTGPNAGDFIFNAAIGKQLKHLLGSFVAGVQQQVNTAPYSLRSYENIYTKRSYSLPNKEIVTMLYAAAESPRFKLSAGVRSYVINDYIYLNEQEKPSQFPTPVNVTQVWLHKVFKLGAFIIDNDLAYQKASDNAPLNIPTILGKHQFSYERALFKKRLKVATGIEIRYNTPFKPAGYDALLNRFYYQNVVNVENIPEESIFLNFRIKRFRAFIMGDYLQQLILHKNSILYTGSPMLNAGSAIPQYAGQNFTIRFGFSWPLVN